MGYDIGYCKIETRGHLIALSPCCGGFFDNQTNIIAAEGKGIAHNIAIFPTLVCGVASHQPDFCQPFVCYAIPNMGWQVMPGIQRG
jgi:hypothetical protein